MKSKISWQGVKQIWGPLFLVLGFFVLASYFAQGYTSEISAFMMDRHIYGVFVYFLINILAVVIAPVSVLPLIPVAASIWGVFWAGLVAVLGWTAGAMIAFYLAQTYGQPWVAKVVPIEKLQRVEKWIPDQNLFWSVLFLRMVIPVDGLSYALGLFSKMKMSSYALATFLGVMPFAFVFAYAGTFPIKYQVVALFLSLVIFYFGMRYYIRHQSSR